MISNETQYFDMSRILLLAVGSWPFRRSKFILFQRIVFFTILISLVVFQLTSFVTAETLTLSVVTDVLSGTLLCIIFIEIYSVLSINSKSMKYLMSQLEQILKEVKDKNEIAIIKKYGEIAKRVIIGFILTLTCMFLLFCCLPFWSHILGFFMVMNESQPHYTIPVVTEYFIDQEKYFYLIILHLDTALITGMTTVVAFGSLFSVYIAYICGIFRIASKITTSCTFKVNVICSLRIELAMSGCSMKSIGVDNDVMARKKIVCAIDIHRKAMEFSTSLLSSYEGSVCVLIVLVIGCLSLNLYVIASSKTDIHQSLLPLLRVPTLLFSMFLGNYFGQMITDHNDDVIFSALMERIFQMVSVSISYVTLIYSMEQ